MKKLIALGSGLIAIVMAAGLAQADNMQVTGLGSYGGLNMRAGPSTNFSIVATMPAGATHINWTCNRRTRGNSTWYEIDWNGVSGWASARYLSYMPGSHRHCRNHVGHTSGSGSGSGHGHTHTNHTHRHSHGGYSHSHPHSHNGHAGHGGNGHFGGNHVVHSPAVPQCVTKQFGALTLKVCP